MTMIMTADQMKSSRKRLWLQHLASQQRNKCRHCYGEDLWCINQMYRWKKKKKKARRKERGECYTENMTAHTMHHDRTPPLSERMDKNTHTFTYTHHWLSKCLHESTSEDREQSTDQVKKVCISANVKGKKKKLNKNSHGVNEWSGAERNLKK